MSNQVQRVLGASAALLRGHDQAAKADKGEMVLIDGGCSVEGCQSDVTRTVVMGKPSEKVTAVFAAILLLFTIEF